MWQIFNGKLRGTGWQIIEVNLTENVGPFETDLEKLKNFEK